MEYQVPPAAWKPLSRTGHTYPLTHRCHNQAFLFRFAIDRQRYRTRMRERLSSHGIALLNYCITSNHTHLLVRVRDLTTETLARFMQSLEGDFARIYSQRKKRQGPSGRTDITR